jgi:SPP1 gp7 family putative phage head morphogenesis protein
MKKRSISSHDYWKAREENNLRHYEEQEQGYNRKVDDLYQSMIDECSRDIEAFYAKYAKEEGITLAEAKRRAAKLDIEAYGRKAKRYVKEKNFSPQANEEMKLYNMTMKVNRLELLKSELSLEMTACADATDKYYSKIFDERAREAYERQAGVLGKTVPDEKTMNRMADNLVHGSFQNPTIDGSYTTFSERIWVNQDALRSAVMTELTRGIIRGLNPRELARSLNKKMKAGRYNAERLMRTELARVQIGAQQQAISDAGYDSYEFIATEGARTCDVCRSLDGKKFKLRKMVVGENAPPMHPFCRCSVCAAMSDEEFKELTGVDPVKLDPGASDKVAKEKITAESKGQEKERAYIQDDGKKGVGHVNLALVNTKKYHEKFENLSNHKAVNESLYQESMVILGDRNNTEYEDIVAIDSRTGKRLEKNTQASLHGKKYRCGFSPEETKRLSDRDGYFEVLHNHPNSSVPSRDDIRKLFERDKQIGSTICCHNGNVYRMEKLKPYIDVAVFEEKAYTYCKEKYADYGDEKIEYECSSRMIKMLSRCGYLKFTKR